MYTKVKTYLNHELSCATVSNFEHS